MPSIRVQLGAEAQLFEALSNGADLPTAAHELGISSRTASSTVRRLRNRAHDSGQVFADVVKAERLRRNVLPLEEPSKPFVSPVRFGERFTFADGTTIALPSRQERRILRPLGEGLSNEDIGAELGLSPLTVKKHLENMADHYGTGNRTKVALMSAAAGFAPVSREPSRVRPTDPERSLVLDGIVRGESNIEIAERAFLPLDTVKLFATQLNREFGTSSRTGLAMTRAKQSDGTIHGSPVARPKGEARQAADMRRILNAQVFERFAAPHLPLDISPFERHRAQTQLSKDYGTPNFQRQAALASQDGRLATPPPIALPRLTSDVRTALDTFVNSNDPMDAWRSTGGVRPADVVSQELQKLGLGPRQFALLGLLATNDGQVELKGKGRERIELTPSPKADHEPSRGNVAEVLRDSSGARSGIPTVTDTRPGRAIRPTAQPRVPSTQPGSITPPIANPRREGNRVSSLPAGGSKTKQSDHRSPATPAPPGLGRSPHPEEPGRTTADIPDKPNLPLGSEGQAKGATANTEAAPSAVTRRNAREAPALSDKTASTQSERAVTPAADAKSDRKTGPVPKTQPITSKAKSQSGPTIRALQVRGGRDDKGGPTPQVRPVVAKPEPRRRPAPPVPGVEGKSAGNDRPDPEARPTVGRRAGKGKEQKRGPGHSL